MKIDFNEFVIPAKEYTPITSKGGRRRRSRKHRTRRHKRSNKSRTRRHH